MLLIFEVLDRFVNGEPGVKKHKSESEIEEKIETESSVASPSQTENEDTLSTANEGVLVLEPIDSLLVLDPTDSFLTHFTPVLCFYTPRKRPKTFGFLTFSVRIEMEHWAIAGQKKYRSEILHRSNSYQVV